jgi:hypothetical protein
MSDTWWDITQDKIAEENEERQWARYDYCYGNCDQHSDECPYYDSTEESWDYEQCHEDKGW